MNKATLFVLVFCFLEYNVVVNADTAVLPPQEKPPELAYKLGCYIPDLKRVLSFNQSSSYPQEGESCMMYKCNFDGYTDIFGCASQSFYGNCVLVPGNRSQPYPECCDRVNCSENKVYSTPKRPSNKNSDDESNKLSKSFTIKKVTGSKAANDEKTSSIEESTSSAKVVSNSEGNSAKVFHGLKNSDKSTSEATKQNVEKL